MVDCVTYAKNLSASRLQFIASLSCFVAFSEKVIAGKKVQYLRYSSKNVYKAI